MKERKAIQVLLQEIYGPAQADEALSRIGSLIEDFPRQKPTKDTFFSQKDVVLITYGDTLKQKDAKPLTALYEFSKSYLKDTISTIHFLPFFPYSSDDGFSVTDFFQINPELGDWDDINRFDNDFDLMFDFVINHYSAQSDWFRYYLEDKQGYQDFAIEVEPETDLSKVTRPRALPLLTAFKKKKGREVHLWTTFSADQIDFNYNSLNVLTKMIEALLFYVRQGAKVLRLDAIAYLWKEIGTDCIHRPQTHAMVNLFRKVLDMTAPEVIIITETNVPHDENISYFGDGRNEAQMVYNFTLPPLLFYSFIMEDASVLSKWAKGLQLESADTTFFNFTASHDGIGVRPLEGILPQKEIAKLADIVKSNGGHVSYKQNPDGSESPYELNITYLDAILADETSSNAAKFLASQAIQYALPGVPATYIHSLLGSRNWHDGVQETGRARTINREKLQIETLSAELKNPQSFRSRIFYPYLELIKTRTRQPAFHPNAAFEIPELEIPGLAAPLFAIKRYTNNQTIYAITNVTSQPVTVDLSSWGVSAQMTDIISKKSMRTDPLKLAPYQFVWLENSG
jgi:sucrose phosphorylase